MLQSWSEAYRGGGLGGHLPHLGEALGLYARLTPDKIGAADLTRQMSFRLWNERACRLANALRGLGLAPGDRVAVLAYNAIEWLEIYAATAKAGLVAVPINFRLLPAEIAYIVANAEARAFIVEDVLAERLEAIRADLPVPLSCYLSFGPDAAKTGWRAYEDLIAAASPSEPAKTASADDLWALMYTSGTTGRPKGAMRTHRASALLSLATEVEMGFGRSDRALLVMPLCHANSLYFASAFLYCGASTFVYSRQSFDPEHLLRTLSESMATFTSLVPTHYVMMLSLASAIQDRYGLDHVRKLLISSAPARLETKEAILERFANSGLFELYGSTEAGWVTMLHPEQQLTKLGSVGRECIASRPVRLVDEAGNEVKDGEVGELFSSTPYAFEGYWRDPEKTAQALREGYCSVGDMARRDADGFLYLVDRKSNMIISGGENIYPSEVEAVVASHPAVKDVAVIGLPDA
ncbi:MAG: AMP-binding protein, partial [Hyphomicrobiaceae bacterium]